MATKFLLKDVRQSFMDFWEPTSVQGSKPAYRGTWMITPGSDNDKAVQAAILEEAKKTWPKDYAKWLESFKGNKMQSCYLRGETWPDRPEYEGLLILRGNRQATSGRPAIVDGQKRILDAKDGKPYSGCYVNVSAEIWGQVGKHTGVRCGLIGVQFVRDGDAFSGGAAASADDLPTLEEGAGASSLV